jgi:L-fucose mutarotase/ribose pyranase (RbsD/FucU family)
VTVDDNADTLYIYDFTNNSACKVTHHSTNNIEPVNRYSAYEEKNNDYAIIVKDDEVDVYVSFGRKV